MKRIRSHIISSCMLIALVITRITVFGQLIQNHPDSLTLESVIIDPKNEKPIAYASIFNQSNNTGTLSNPDGYFKLTGLSPKDTLRISFVGYNKLIVAVSEISNSDTVYLKPKEELLNEVVILADNSYLYDLVAGCKKTNTPKPLTAKTYFELESYTNGQQVELVEAYYNGNYKGYDVSELNIKAGRLGLSGFENRLFVSLETSKALVMHKTYKDNTYFPGSPLECNKSRLMKQFSLRLVSKYRDENSESVYVIDYKPKDSSECLFEGRLWIDSTSNNLHKVTYRINNACNHPFLTYFDLMRIDIEITKTFQYIHGNMYTKSMDFNYQVFYIKKENDSMLTVSTNAVLYAYDYIDQFTLPFFEFVESMSGDYRKISAIPYNDFFWNYMNEFKLNDRKNKNELFFKEYATLTNQKFFSEFIFKDNAHKGFFESPYRYWSDKRIFFRENLDDNTAQNIKGSIPSTLYNLEAQIFMDINEYNDSINVITKTIFDPFKSYYHLPLTKVSTTFINLYFDIVEIKRRELEQEIHEKGKDIYSIKKIYEDKMEEVDEITKSFFDEVDRGTKQKATLKWNEYVKENLGIDNVEIFGPYDREE